MKHVFVFLMLIASFGHSDEKNSISEEFKALSGYQKCEVLLLFLGEADRNVGYESIIESFKKYGQVTVKETRSMIQDVFFDLEPRVPVCFFTINKNEDKIEVSLEVHSGEKPKENNDQGSSPIWNKEITIPVSDEGKNDTDIANLIKEVATCFAEDWKKANQTANQPKPSFHILRSEEL